MMGMLVLIDGEPEPVASVADRTVPGPAGDIPVRIYRGRPGDEALPVLVWYHGGGWVIGDLDSADTTARKLANRSGALVVSVDYRLAPEHPFPAAVDDCWAALEWVAAHAGRDRRRPEPAGRGRRQRRRQPVGGDGGAGPRRRRGPAPPAAGLPGHRRHPVPAVDRGERRGVPADPQRHDLVHGPLPGRRRPQGSRGCRPCTPTTWPGVAPATVFTAEFDPLRDEGAGYAERLDEAGVETELPRATRA